MSEYSVQDFDESPPVVNPRTLATFKKNFGRSCGAIRVCSGVRWACF